MSATTVQRLVIENWVPANAANQRIHWAAKHRQAKLEKELVYWHAKREQWTKVEGKARLTITMSFVGVLPDHDNAVARCKAAVDGLKGAFFRDDSPDCLELVVRTERGPKQTTMELEGIE